MTATNEELEKRVDALEKQMRRDHTAWTNKFGGVVPGEPCMCPICMNDKPTDPQPSQNPVCHHTVMLMSNPPKCQLCGWVLEEKPSPPDPYKEFKDCLAGGGMVDWFNATTNSWYPIVTHTRWESYPPDRYRIAKPAKKAESLGYGFTPWPNGGEPHNMGLWCQTCADANNKPARKAEEDQPRDIDDQQTVNAIVDGMKMHAGTMHGMAIGALAKIKAGEVPGIYAKADGDSDRGLRVIQDLRAKLAKAEEQVKRARSGQIAWMKDSLRNWSLLADSEKSNAELVLKLRDEIERLRRFHQRFCVNGGFPDCLAVVGNALLIANDQTKDAWVAAKGTT